jgi:hypothetical protein
LCAALGMAKKKYQPKTVAADSGNRYEPVKAVNRDAEGRIVSQPGDVRKVAEEVSPVEAEKVIEDEQELESEGRSQGRPRLPNG